MRLKVLVECANWSANPIRWVRTGIQEVVLQAAIACVRQKTVVGDSSASPFESIELKVLPWFPVLDVQGMKAVPFDSIHDDWIFEFREMIVREMGLTLNDFFGWNVENWIKIRSNKKQAKKLSDDLLYEQIEWADHLHIQSLIDLRPYQQIFQKNKVRTVSQTLYDLIPLLYPELADHGMARWFGSHYLAGVTEVADDVVAISRSSAIDYQEFKSGWLNLKPGQIKNNQTEVVLNVPVEGEVKFGVSGFDRALQTREGQRLAEIVCELQGAPYVIFLGSVEPRKNLLALIEGFRQFREVVRETVREEVHETNNDAKLLIVGASGWKNELTDAAIDKGIREGWIVRTGYVADGVRDELIKKAKALVMLSFYEGYGLPIAHARKWGVSVVTTFASSMPEAARGQATFVDPASIDSVAAGLRVVFEFTQNSRLARLPGTWLDYANELGKLWVSRASRSRAQSAGGDA